MKNLFLILMLIGLLSSCGTDDTQDELNPFIPTEVFVAIKSGTDIKALFQFINQFDLPVDHIFSLSYTSTLPSEDLQDVLDGLNEKTYTHDGRDWFVTGYLHSQTNQIWIFPRLFDMHNTDYQQDWLASHPTFQLAQVHQSELPSGIIKFKVPEGQEVLWKNRFNSYDIVEWADLNYILETEPNTL